VPGQITALRIETLTDPSLPKTGPGRSENGNFVLNELRVTYRPLEKDIAPAAVKLTAPAATIQQDGFPAANAIDNNPASGWAVGNGVGKNQAVMMKSHLDAERRWPRQVNPRVRLPDALELLMTRLIARHPAERPASAFEVRAQLLAILSASSQGGSGKPASTLSAGESLSDRPLPGVPLPNFGPGWDAPPKSPSCSQAPTLRQPNPLLGH
jgi:hypothetical protein